MDRQANIAMWDELWESGLWYASLGKAVAGLTAAQAAWKPASAPGVAGSRHSIWQNVNHMIFWRGVAVSRSRGGAGPTEVEVAAGNFAEPKAVTDGAWAEAVAELKRSHGVVREAMADEQVPMDRLKYLIPHDSYHVGQIMQTRAMLGLAPVE